MKVVKSTSFKLKPCLVEIKRDLFLIKRDLKLFIRGLNVVTVYTVGVLWSIP